MSQHIAVIGAGAVGICSALWLQRSGHRVTLIDPSPPGSGTSSGNACTIADYACIPVNSPAIFADLPRLLFARGSPLRVDPVFALANPGWLIRFLSHCRRAKVDHSIQALGSLLRHTNSGLDPLIEASGAKDLMRQQGCLYVYQSRRAWDAAWGANLQRREQGVAFETLDAEQIRDLEPAMQQRFHAGLLFSNARQTVNPASLCNRFTKHFSENGGELIAAKVTRIDKSEQTTIFADGTRITADRFLIAAGAFSSRIAGAGLSRVPLGTERGYHVQYQSQQLLTRPVGWAEAGLYATPTSEGLRLAGTVEIAGLDRPANQANLDLLSSRARELFGIEETPTQTWLGFRPTLPDALPVIDRTPCGRILYAFGHQHIGLTLSGITGKLIADLVDGKDHAIDLSPFAINRFR